MNVPFLDLSRQTRLLAPELTTAIEAVDGVWESLLARALETKA